jgi:colanic acid/amylovoran biosynthesis glycosyltransferase
MTPARVAYVVSTFPKISETFIAGELAELRRRGVDVRVLSLKPPCETVHHQIVDAAGLLERTTYRPAEFRRQLKEFCPDLVHAHFATEPTAAARAIAAEMNLPFTFTAHGYDVYRKPPTDFAERAEAAAAVVTVSDANRRYLTDSLGVSPGRVHVIPCGIDTDWFTPGTENPRLPLIVAVARLRDVKRLDILIRACALLRDRGTLFRCVIVGDGPERGALESLRAELQLDDQITLTGIAEQCEVRRWWQRATVAVLSSRAEGMPVSLMEAAACGVPAVAPAVGGIPELIGHRKTGIVTAPLDPLSLAEGLYTLLTDEAMRRRMRWEARARAEERFSRKSQVDRLLALWSGVVDRGVPCH